MKCGMKSGNASRAWTLALPAMFVALFSALLSGCFGGDDPAGTSTETNTGKTTGMVLLADGKPAKGATVKVFPVGYRPAQDSFSIPAYRTETDDQGGYTLDSLVDGEYNILGSLDGQAAFEDSVIITSKPKTLDTLFLDDPGTVSGYVALEPGDPLPTVIVQALGTQAYANVNEEGFFRLPALAAGVYRLAVSTTLPDYTTFYGDIRVRAGFKDTLADTLRPIFTGIPLAPALSAVYDTLSGMVHLTWPASEYGNLDAYLIYRDDKGAPERSTSSIAAVKDTAFTDTLFNAPGRIRSDTGVYDTTTLRYEYRLALRDKFGERGRTFGTLTVTAPSPSHVLTYATLVSEDVGAATIRDSVRYFLAYRNLTRSITSIEWSVNGKAGEVRTLEPGKKEGLDTLALVCPAEPGTLEIAARITDQSGARWDVRRSLQVILDRPAVNLTGDSVARKDGSIRVKAIGSDGEGRIGKWEWDVGAKGVFTAGTADDSIVPAPGMIADRYAVVVRVTDDDGLTAEDTLWTRIVPWKLGTPPPLPAANSSAVSFGGKVYVFGGSIITSVSDPMTHFESTARSFVYDPASDHWKEIASMSRAKTSAWAVATDSRIYLFSGYPHPVNSTRGTDVEEYDPATDTWTRKGDMPYVRGFAPFVLEGKINFIGGRLGNTTYSDTLEVYDPSTDAWTRRHLSQSGPTEFVVTASHGPDAYVLSNNGVDGTMSIQKVDAATMGRTSLPDIKLKEPIINSDFLGWPPLIATRDGSLYLAGGAMRVDAFDGRRVNAYSPRVRRYGPSGNAWTDWHPFPAPYHPEHLLVAGGKLIALGGQMDTTDHRATVEIADLAE